MVGVARLHSEYRLHHVERRDAVLALGRAQHDHQHDEGQENGRYGHHPSWQPDRQAAGARDQPDLGRFARAHRLTLVRAR